MYGILVPYRLPQRPVLPQSLHHPAPASARAPPRPPTSSPRLTWLAFQGSPCQKLILLLPSLHPLLGPRGVTGTPSVPHRPAPVSDLPTTTPSAAAAATAAAPPHSSAGVHAAAAPSAPPRESPVPVPVVVVVVLSVAGSTRCATTACSWEASCAVAVASCRSCRLVSRLCGVFGAQVRKGGCG